VSIKAYDDKQAHTLLKKHKLQGYFVFDKGMTKAFYKQGELPISVMYILKLVVHLVYKMPWSYLYQKQNSLEVYVFLTKIKINQVKRN
jgi:hypothetical protein